MQAETRQQAKELQAHLKQLSNFSSWKIIRNELESIVGDLEVSILEVDNKKNEVNFTQHDINRVERKILKMLIHLPEDMFDELQDFEEEQP